MSSDAAPTTPAADDRVPEDRVPEPRSAEDSLSVPEPAPAPPAGPVDEAADEPSDDAGADAAPVAEVTATAPETAPEPAPDPAPPAVPDARVPEEEPAGGRLTARVREAHDRLAPEPLAIPAPRSPEGVVPPPEMRRTVGPAKDLVAALVDLRGRLARLEGAAGSPERRALVRVLELSSTGVPDAGWSLDERIEAAALAAAADEAGALHATAAALLARLDAEDRAASAVEVDAVVTALQVARMVLDLESFARHGR
ncbi:hypothetical protein GCM10023200_51600 [Actinomycetospora chlora]|uniref:Uncharacterized protein n=1 Tax=Actinomycetospora chlora TaxID=663608 RepID=A0ABP9CAY2_9PSEU